MYTIIITIAREGQIEKQVERKEVRNECNRLKKIFSSRLINNHVCIEVENNETGEIREFWNNNDNTIKF